MNEKQFHEILDACGGSYEPLASSDVKAWLVRWREVYAVGLFAATGRWKMGPYEWHVFSFDHAHALNGNRALEQYAEQALQPVIVYPEAMRLPAMRLEPEQLPSFAAHRVDVYVWPESLDWTMAFTHEASIGLGPYFSRREWATPVPEPLGEVGRRRTKRR